MVHYVRFLSAVVLALALASFLTDQGPIWP